MTWFGDLGLSLSANKSEMMVLLRKHAVGQTAIRNVTEFKYLGIIFDRKLTWRQHAEYIQAIAGQSWDAHPACLLVLYKSTVRSVIENSGVCFSGMPDCHMRRLEWIQWRAGRICFGLMRSKHVLSVEVLAGLPPIRQAFVFKREVPGFGFG
jgi:hypothetical protein